MYFVNKHFKVYHWLAVQNVSPWSVGSYYRQVVHFENIHLIAIGSGRDKFSESIHVFIVWFRRML